MVDLRGPTVVGRPARPRHPEPDLDLPGGRARHPAGRNRTVPVSSLGHTVLFPTLFGWHNVVAWQSQSESPWLAVVVVGTLGNVIGSQLAYALGRWGRSGPFAPGTGGAP